jgi:hypothetical protein
MNRGLTASGWRTGALLAGLVLLFYLITLAPTALWGDSGHFQRTAYQGALDADGGGRFVWFQAARLFLRLPWGEPAWRVNLLSAVAGALTILGVIAAARQAGLSHAAAAAAGLMLAVSHTFWLQAVRAEIYTVFAALMSLELWLWFRWRPENKLPVVAAILLLAPLVLAHQMTVLLLPALAYLLWRRRSWLGLRQWGGLLAIALGTLGISVLVLHWQVGASTLIGSLVMYFTHFGIDFASAFLDFSLADLPRDAITFIAFFCLQFVGPGLILIFMGVVSWLRARQAGEEVWAALAVLYLTDVLFAFSYRINERFVFFLPGYLVCVLFAGRGWDALARSWRPLQQRVVQAALLALLVVTPIGAYATSSLLLTTLKLNPLGIRQLPYREPNRHFLWPATAGDDGAARYARAALSAIPPGSLLIADYTPFEPLAYVQSAEGLGAGVRLVQIHPEDDLGALIEELGAGAEVFLADNNPKYYRLDTLPGFVVEPVGVVYRLVGR